LGTSSLFFLFQRHEYFCSNLFKKHHGCVFLWKSQLKHKANILSYQLIDQPITMHKRLFSIIMPSSTISCCFHNLDKLLHALAMHCFIWFLQIFMKYHSMNVRIFDSISLVHIVILPTVSHIVDRLQNPSMISSMSFSYKVGIASKDFTRKVIPNGEPFM